MNDQKRSHVQIALHLTTIGVAIIIAAWYAHYTNKSVESLLSSQIVEQKAKIHEIAEITDRNGADAVVSEIIEDCPRRSDYESLLVKLSTLPKKELMTVQNLFESCGHFYAERKALMVSRLSRELDALFELHELSQALHAPSMEKIEMSQWTELIVLEKKRSSFLSEQADIQALIISALISGSTANSSDVSGLVQEAQQIAELLAVHDHEVDRLRESLRK